MPALSSGNHPTVPDPVGPQPAGTSPRLDAVRSDELPNTRSLTNQGLAVATFGSAAGMRVASEWAWEIGGKVSWLKVVFALATSRSTPLASARVVELVWIPAESASRSTTRPTARPTPRAVSAERPG